VYGILGTSDGEKREFVVYCILGTLASFILDGSHYSVNGSSGHPESISIN